MDFAPLLERVARLRVVVVGDLILDHYVQGDAHRLSPEAPVPVVLVEHDRHVPGGAANVALNLAELGARVGLCGVFGLDAGGRELVGLLDARGVALEPGWARPGTPTIVKTRVLVRGQQLCRVDREAPATAYGLREDDWARLEGALDGADAVILSDYAKGVVDSAAWARLRALAAERGVFFAYDPKPRRGLAFVGPDLMTPNRKEALELAGLELDHRADFPAEEVCAQLWARHRPRYLVVTLGAGGMLLSEGGQPPHRIPTFAREVFDVSGAGDTAIAALTAALAAGAPLATAAAFANTAAGVVVAKLGTATAAPAEILAYHQGG